MNIYDVLLEDEDDIIASSPRKRYWGILSQVEEDKMQNEFDKILARIATLELMAMEHNPHGDIDSLVASYYRSHSNEVEEGKTSLYMEYAAKLIFTQND